LNDLCLGKTSKVNFIFHLRTQLPHLLGIWRLYITDRYSCIYTADRGLVRRVGRCLGRARKKGRAWLRRPCSLEHARGRAACRALCARAHSTRPPGPDFRPTSRAGANTAHIIPKLERDSPAGASIHSRPVCLASRCLPPRARVLVCSQPIGSLAECLHQVGPASCSPRTSGRLQLARA
jgi:hypothetical protein